jgi:hypothetical protein
VKAVSVFNKKIRIVIMMFATGEHFDVNPKQIKPPLIFLKSRSRLLLFIHFILAMAVSLSPGVLKSGHKWSQNLAGNSGLTENKALESIRDQT